MKNPDPPATFRLTQIKERIKALRRIVGYLRRMGRQDPARFDDFYGWLLKEKRKELQELRALRAQQEYLDGTGN